MNSLGDVAFALFVCPLNGIDVRRLSRITLMAALVCAAFAIAAPVGAQADDPPQPSIEETFEYPGADEIFGQRGIRLVKGDGHIVLADCVKGTSQAEVWSRNKGQYCFRVTGSTGYLTLELTEFYLVKGAGGQEMAAKVIVDGNEETVAVKKSTWVSIGEGADPGNGPATLVELRVTGV